MFSGGIRLFRLFGTEVYLHPMWFIMLFLFVVPSAMSGNIVGAVSGFALLIALYASVLAHEFSHIFMGRRFGVETRTIVINFFGGAAMMERIPFGLPEVAIGIAGPALSAVLGILISLPFFLGVQHGGGVLSIVYTIGYINLILAFFNILPIFPMDGGRVLRGLLFHYNKKIVKSTRIALIVGFITFPIAVLTIFGFDLWVIVIMGLIAWMGLGEWKQIKSLYHDDMEDPNLLQPQLVRQYLKAVVLLGPDSPEAQGLRKAYANPEFDRLADAVESQWNNLSDASKIEVRANYIREIMVAHLE